MKNKRELITALTLLTSLLMGIMLFKKSSNTPRFLINEPSIELKKTSVTSIYNGLTDYDDKKIIWKTSILPQKKVYPVGNSLQLGVTYKLNNGPDSFKIIIDVTNPNSFISKAETVVSEGNWTYVTYPDDFMVGSDPLDWYSVKADINTKGEYSISYAVADISGYGNRVTSDKFKVE